MIFKQKPGSFIFVTVIIAMVWMFGNEVKAREWHKFTIERLSEKAKPVASKMWSMGTVLIIEEAITPSRTCDKIDAEVNIDGKKIFVKIKSSKQGLPNSPECSERSSFSGVKLIIRDIPTGNLLVRLETPERQIEDNVRVEW